MSTTINFKLFIEDGFEIIEEDLVELQKMIQNKHIQPYFMGCNILKVNGYFININKIVFDTENNTVSIFLDGYLEDDDLQ